MWFALLLSAAVLSDQFVIHGAVIGNAKLGNPAEALSMVLYYKNASDITEPMVKAMEKLAENHPVVIEMIVCETGINQKIVHPVCVEQKDNLPYMLRSYMGRQVGSKFVNDVNVMTTFTQNWLKYFDYWTKYSFEIQRQFVVAVYTDKEVTAELKCKLDALEVTLPVLFQIIDCKKIRSKECKQGKLPLVKLLHVGLANKWAEQTSLDAVEIDSIVSDISKQLGFNKVSVPISTKRLYKDEIHLVDYKAFVDSRILVFHMPGKDDQEMDIISTAAIKEKLTVPIVRISCSEQAKKKSGLIHPNSDKPVFSCISKDAAIRIPYNEETVETDLKKCHDFARRLAAPIIQIGAPVPTIPSPPALPAVPTDFPAPGKTSYRKITPFESDRFIAKEFKALFFFHDGSEEAKEQTKLLQRLHEDLNQSLQIYEINCKHSTLRIGFYCGKQSDGFFLVVISGDETVVINHTPNYEELKAMGEKVLASVSIAA
jgi:hypothetical protein